MLNVRCVILDNDIKYKNLKCSLIVAKSKDIISKAEEYGIPIFKVKTTNKYEILKDLIYIYGINIDLKNDRLFCSMCGNFLEKITSKDAQIPQKVKNYHQLIYFCKKCKKYYWYGKHWDNVRKNIRNILNKKDIQ